MIIRGLTSLISVSNYTYWLSDENYPTNNSTNHSEWSEIRKRPGMYVKKTQLRVLRSIKNSDIIQYYDLTFSTQFVFHFFLTQITDINQDDLINN